MSRKDNSNSTKSNTKNTNNKQSNKPIIDNNDNNPFISHTGHKLTLNESRFIDEYIKCGNATQAYIIAYDKDQENPPKHIRQTANNVITKTYIQEEIKYRAEQLHDESIADAEEIMQYFTDVMRGKITDQFGLEAPLSERTKAAQELAKRQIDIMNKGNSNQEAPEIKITLDWGSGEQKPTVNSIMNNSAE